jgi:hypothetical protein
MYTSDQHMPSWRNFMLWTDSNCESACVLQDVPGVADAPSLLMKLLASATASTPTLGGHHHHCNAANLRPASPTPPTPPCSGPTFKPALLQKWLQKHWSQYGGQPPAAKYTNTNRQPGNNRYSQRWNMTSSSASLVSLLAPPPQDGDTCQSCHTNIHAACMPGWTTLPQLQ